MTILDCKRTKKTGVFLYIYLLAFVIKLYASCWNIFQKHGWDRIYTASCSGAYFICHKKAASPLANTWYVCFLRRK